MDKKTGDIDGHNLETSILHGMFIIGYQKMESRTDPFVRTPSPLSQEAPGSISDIEQTWKNISTQDKDLNLTGLTFLHPNTFASYIEGTEIGLEEVEDSVKGLVNNGCIKKFKILYFIHNLNERLMPSLHFRKIETSLEKIEETEDMAYSLTKTFINLIISLKKCTSVTLKKTLDGLIENMSSSIPSQVSIQKVLDSDDVNSLCVVPKKKDLVLDRDIVWPKPKLPFISGINPFEQSKESNQDEDNVELDLIALQKVLKDLETDVHLEDWDVEDARECLKDDNNDLPNRYKELLESMLVGED